MVQDSTLLPKPQTTICWWYPSPPFFFCFLLLSFFSDAVKYMCESRANLYQHPSETLHDTWSSTDYTTTMIASTWTLYLWPSWPTLTKLEIGLCVSTKPFNSHTKVPIHYYHYSSFPSQFCIALPTSHLLYFINLLGLRASATLTSVP